MTLSGTLHFWHTAPPSHSHASKSVYHCARVISILPAAVEAPPRGCGCCAHLPTCRVDGPACEATLIAEDGGRMVRL